MVPEAPSPSSAKRREGKRREGQARWKEASRSQRTERSGGLYQIQSGPLLRALSGRKEARLQQLRGRSPQHQMQHAGRKQLPVTVNPSGGTRPGRGSSGGHRRRAASSLKTRSRDKAQSPPSLLGPRRSPRWDPIPVPENWLGVYRLRRGQRPGPRPGVRRYVVQDLP